ncbi:sulfotransferase family 2 domain-containing protein [Roseovarius sp.]|uniref:sulfotransferase family 2 domain-containing protein n=1 Tax=Roseovarius sp. TaxID=1486281 RepID=UPI00262ED21B|nr:sulfotransferase family 2 domain-containing protein [Roseovarius sp.]
MLVFSKANLVFLSVPKTGSTAYQAALAPLAAIAVTSPPELKHAPVFRYNRFFRPMIERFISADVDVLAVMREPISWLGSWYRYRQRSAIQGTPNGTHDISFDDFVSAYCMGKQPDFAAVGAQSKFLEPQRNGTCVTHLFRYEDQPGLMRFLENRLETRIRTAPLNASPARPLELSARTEARLRRKFASDFALWNGIGEGGQYCPLPARPKPGDDD